MPFSIYDPYSTSLFDDKPYSYDYDKAIKDMEEQERLEKEAQAKRDAEAQRKMEQKAFRREQWALAIPAITAALVASDTSEITRALSNYSELVSASFARRQQSKEAGLERTHDIGMQEDRQAAAKEAQLSEFGFQANQNTLTRDFTAGENVKSREFEFEKLRRQDEQRMKEAGYDRETSIILSDKHAAANRAALAYGAQLDRETQAMEVARGLELEIAENSPVSVDIARSLADKLARSAPLNTYRDEERAAYQIWLQNRREESQDKKELNAMGHVLEYMRTEKPSGLFDDLGNPIMIPRTKEDALEAFPALDRIFSTPSVNDGRDSSGNTEEERNRSQDWIRGRDYVLQNPQVKQTFSAINEQYKSEDTRGLAMQRAAQGAIKLTEGNSPDAAMGVIDTLQIDPDLKGLMRETVRQQAQSQQSSGGSGNPIISPTTGNQGIVGTGPIRGYSSISGQPSSFADLLQALPDAGNPGGGNATTPVDAFMYQLRTNPDFLNSLYGASNVTSINDGGRGRAGATSEWDWLDSLNPGGGRTGGAGFSGNF